MKKDEGMTILELMVALAIGSIIIYGAFQFYNFYNDYISHSERQKNQKMLMNNLFKLTKRATRLIRWQAFHVRRSYVWSKNDDFSLIQWDPLAMSNTNRVDELTFNYMSEDKSDVLLGLYNNSFTLEVLGNEGRIKDSYIIVDENGNDLEVSLNSVSGILVSRCIGSSDINRNYSVNQIINLPRAPFGYFDSNDDFKVACCPILNDPATTVSACNDGDIVGENSRWRSRVFFINRNSGVSTYPKKGDIRFISSAGFSLYFDDTVDPNNYKIYFFSYANTCQSFKDQGLQRDDCKPKRIFNREVLTGKLNKEYNESGVIRIDE